MSISGSMFTAQTAIDVFSDSMGVAGDNIANLNTVGFKTSRQSFADLLPTVDGAFEVGHGVRLASVSSPFQQGSIEGSDNATDLAIQGNGYFILKNSSGGTYYSRAGEFQLDKDRNLANPAGLLLQGLSGNLSLANAGTLAAQQTSQLGLAFNLDATATTPEAAFPAGPDASQSAWVSASNFSLIAPVFDSNGTQHDVTFLFRKSGANTWDYRTLAQRGELDATAPSSTEQRQLGNAGTLVFAADGTLDSAASTIADLGTITWANGASDTIGASAIDMTKAVQYGQASFVQSISQDGTAQGSLNGIRIGADGVVTAQYSNGQFKAIDTVALATFPNVDDLERLGGTLFGPTVSSGAATVGAPGTSGRGNLLPGSLELSTVDLAAQFVTLLTSQRSFQVNSKVITTADEMYTVAADLKR
jgi:flagellar hook protein FlgE